MQVTDNEKTQGVSTSFKKDQVMLSGKKRRLSGALYHLSVKTALHEAAIVFRSLHDWKKGRNLWAFLRENHIAWVMIASYDTWAWPF